MYNKIATTTVQQEKKKPNWRFSAIGIFITFAIAVFPNDTYHAAHEGLRLWLDAVCPSLLPFLICVHLFRGLNLIESFEVMFEWLMQPLFRLPGKTAYSLIMSGLSSYPVGAISTVQLYRDGSLRDEEAQRALSLCSTSGPLFIMGTIAAALLNRPNLGLPLLLVHYASAVTIGLMIRNWNMPLIKRPAKSVSKPQDELTEAIIKQLEKMASQPKNDTIGAIVKWSIEESGKLLLAIGGFIIFFSVIADVLKITGILTLLSKTVCLLLPFWSLDVKVVESFIIGLLEITNGAKACSVLDIPMLYKLSIISFMISFGGLSIHAQVLSVITSTRLRSDVYFGLKILQGVIAAVYAFIVFGIFMDVPVFNNDIASLSNVAFYHKASWFELFMQSFTNVVYILVFGMVASALLHIGHFISSVMCHLKALVFRKAK